MASSLKNALFAVVLFAGIENQLYAWGKIGHRVVGQVAQGHLNEKTKGIVSDLLGGRDLADVSNFADEVRSDSSYDEYLPLHYVNIPRGQHYDNAPRNPKGDVVVGIEKFSLIVKDSTQTKAKRKEALSYLVHLIGDLHQPLHVGLPEDRGGNDVKILWFGVESNLHKIWDEDLVKFEELSYVEYAAMLARLFSKDQIKQWMAGDARSWMKESLELRDLVYPQAGETDLRYAYHFKHKDLLYRRLFQGGLRLAHQLNLILGK